MARAIPEHLRRRALRKLWVSDPALACLDDLVDYADDYTQASAVTNFTTSYEVGKGLRRHIEDVARKAAASLEAASDTAEAPAIDEDTQPAAPVEIDAPAAVAQADAPAETAIADAAIEEPAALPPRRMAFRFEEHRA
jgi:hypothetical protein